MRHEEACIGAMQVVMLDGPQVRPEHMPSLIELDDVHVPGFVVQPEVR